MHFKRQLTRFAAPLLIALFGLALTGVVARAYPPPAASGATTQACPTAAAGASCQLTFFFVNGISQPVTGAAVTFSVSGPGSVNPTSGVTDTNGHVSTTFTASSTSCGNAVVTATSGTASAQTTVGVVCAASTSLPNTSTGTSGTSPLAYAGILLAALVLMGGAVALRRTRRPL